MLWFNGVCMNFWKKKEWKLQRAFTVMNAKLISLLPLFSLQCNQILPLQLNHYLSSNRKKWSQPSRPSILCDSYMWHTISLTLTYSRASIWNMIQRLWLKQAKWLNLFLQIHLHTNMSPEIDNNIQFSELHLAKLLISGTTDVYWWSSSSELLFAANHIHPEKCKQALVY